MVEKRAKRVEETVLPYAHTIKTQKLFNAWQLELTTEAFGHMLRFPHAILGEHAQNKELMINRYGKQLKVSVVGAGPIGLAASLMFFKLGYEVVCYEQFTNNLELEEKEAKTEVEEKGRAEHRGFAQRGQPFSLVRQSYWLLDQLGVSIRECLNAFGVPPPPPLEVLQQRGVSEEGWAFLKISTPLLNEARIARIGSHAEHYVPNAMSLPTRKVQELLYRVFGQIQKSHDENRIDINILFGKKCTYVKRDPVTGRSALQFNEEGQDIESDIIFNASGGKINELLGFTQTHIAKMHGLGVFFPPPAKPVNKTDGPILSRAVRPFCSFNKDEEIYVNMELDEKEFHDEAAIKELINNLATDMGFPVDSAIRHFKVEIDLSHATKTIRRSRETNPTIIPQLVINGGDGAIKPHFITASGANFGLSLLTGLLGLLQQQLRGRITQTELCKKYAELSRVMQKQSAQMVVNLFARKFPN